MKKKILIIEDDGSLVKIIAGAVDRKEFEVVIASSAEEGYKKAIAGKPALIVLDVLLPAKNGFECLRDLKKNKVTAKIPVIFLSNLGQIEEIKTGLKLGAVDYLVKADFTIDEVINKIVKAIK